MVCSLDLEGPGPHMLLKPIILRQSFKTKVVVHLPNSKVGQVFTPTLIPLYLAPRWGAPNEVRASLQPQARHTAVSEQSKAGMSRGKVAI